MYRPGSSERPLNPVGGVPDLRQTQRRVSAADSEICLQVYGSGYELSLTERNDSIGRQQSMSGKVTVAIWTRDDDHDPCKSWYSPTPESTIYLTSNPGGLFKSGTGAVQGPPDLI